MGTATAAQTGDFPGSGRPQYSMRSYRRPPGTLAPEIPSCGRYATGLGTGCNPPSSLSTRGNSSSGLAGTLCTTVL
eukprot:4219892-Heterocapsa_arctica.AAC.1